MKATEKQISMIEIIENGTSTKIPIKCLDKNKTFEHYQSLRLLAYLKNNPAGVTHFEIINRYGILNVSSVIFWLNQQLTENRYIKTTPEIVKGNNGVKVKMNRYRLTRR